MILHPQQLGLRAIINQHGREHRAFHAVEKRAQKRLVGIILGPEGHNAEWRGDRLDADPTVPYHGNVAQGGGNVEKVLTADDFAPYIGKAFTPRGQHRVLTLVSIDRLTFPGIQNLPRAPFSLLFSGPPGDVLPDRIYDVAVQDGPDFVLFISPIQTYARDRQDYQAVFN